LPARAFATTERKSGATAELVAAGEPVSASLPVKITLYRLLQEALANGFRHAGAIAQRIELAQSPGQLTIEISDAGPGFDAGGAKHGGGIGLAGMARARAVARRVVRSTIDAAGWNRICVTLPSSVPEKTDD
jgi:signal transduction histidine kinase